MKTSLVPSGPRLLRPALGALALAFAVVFGPLTQGLAGQDSHYWSEQFGNRSMLLSGTVIGSVSDLGTVFYNPGRLALIDNPAFVLTAKVYQWDRYRIEDALGESLDLKESEFGGAPNLVAGTFTLPFLEDHHFAYAFLTRKRAQSNFYLRRTDEGDLIEVLPGEEYFEGRAGSKKSLKEEWIGLDWAREWWEGISIGVSTFVTIEDRSSDFAVNLVAVNEEPRVGLLHLTRGYSYSTYGMVWKAGLAMEFDNLNVGLTVTTPKLSVWGDGSVDYENLLIGVDTSGTGTPDDELVISLQSGLTSKTRSPWAVGAGLGWSRGNFTLHASAEWYGAVAKYTVVQSKPFVGQSTGKTQYYRVVDESQSVLNAGVGLEYRASDNFAFFASVATDGSAAPEDAVINLEQDNLVNDKTFAEDFLLFGGGVDLKTRWADLTLGATWAGASQPFERQLEFPNGDEDVLPQGDQATFHYSRWRFLLGFSIPFAKDIADRVAGEEPKDPGR